jgi:hypothetical protein
MKYSNLAERLEQFEAEEREASKTHSVPRVFPAAVPQVSGRAPRRLTLMHRRIQIRDSGLPHFRVF